MAELDSFTPRRKRSNRCKSSINRSPASPKKKKFFTFSARKMSRLYWNGILRSFTLFNRFAVTFHRQRRGKRQTQTALSQIPGVGPRTAQKLLKEFGSVANVQRAGLEKLSSVISRKNAERILSQLEHSKAP